ncbi:hypothetical protein SAMN05660649_05033 [Desulfotomaculum arcticum]|uniref:Uncharacterized protein n=1 Tax=Desulfotruncus arcticus DSM 17038 TaxID=1121424 RepID=A0A1I2ZNW2_9FIRM|nr:hypothetical protein [Desulfotruncus arcticus]SFH39296.1 hypothetical protein SAMN05660649_05033 [Desulfotomaculum arcticum] [Desulfotruncus arcticus DSM 17038]
MAYIHVYLSDGTTQVSEGTGDQAITFTLNASNNEEGTPMRLFVKAEAGFQTTAAGVTITIVDNSASGKEQKWALAPDNAGAAGTFGNYGAALTLPGVVTNAGTPFWVKARATNDEPPQNDTSVDLKVEGVVEAV